MEFSPPATLMSERLIDAGANSAGKELFHLAAIDTLRVFVAIPEVYSRAARPAPWRP